MAKDRGKRPPRPAGELREPAKPASHDNETPKFCLHYLSGGFDVRALTPEAQAAFARTLQKLAASKWKELITAPRHGQGSELLPAATIKAAIPVAFQDTDRFMVFRYHGRLPMAGVRVRDVFHVLWIEPNFGDLYNHG